MPLPGAESLPSLRLLANVWHEIEVDEVMNLSQLQAPKRQSYRSYPLKTQTNKQKNTAFLPLGLLPNSGQVEQARI